MSAAKNNKQQLDAIIDELAKLRLSRERADAIFLLRLREAEIMKLRKERDELKTRCVQLSKENQKR